MKRVERKTAPQVQAGQVQKKSNWEETPFYDISEQPELVIDRQRPSNGYRHLLTQADISRFLAVIPDWDKHSVGLNAIVLALGYKDYFGYYRRGVIYLCAWALDDDIIVPEGFYQREAKILQLLNVSCWPEGDGAWRLGFDENTARAYQLLSILLHELGHHNDYLNTRSPAKANRGEVYADEFALHLGLQIWPRYQKAFGI